MYSLLFLVVSIEASILSMYVLCFALIHRKIYKLALILIKQINIFNISKKNFFFFKLNYGFGQEQSEAPIYTIFLGAYFDCVFYSYIYIA